MQKINFTERINAPKEKVWQTLWTDENYRKWTSAFCEGSYAETDNWKEGTEVRFLGPGESGMFSKVAENKPNKFMSFEHLGEVTNGVVDTTSDKVKAWSGSKENYTLTENDGITTLVVDMDIADEYKEMFEKMWPKAMENIKALAEKN